ncbi:MAG TPA: thioredoxin domain-containing protein [Thermoanaerobaculia bacterium]|jgi:hypothetical protein|nr:thioredoxin domain-containing protein [Thermoanaerobaculia bacterium]
MSSADPQRPGNRLAAASSPYLRLHAHNPVDWYPWGDEAITRARREDKPIFLSIGYSTCYWCHVMERESFSDPAIAALMNERFVNVKLDREERPDLDEVYMTATQLMTGQGGWPNSLFLTPKLEPFFAGTYFPPDDKWGRPGFRSVLQGIGEAWTARRGDVDEQARELGDAIRHHLGGRFAPAAGVPGPELFDAALRTLAQRFDPTWGGFGEAPKFPTPSNLMLLLEAAEGGDAEARRMLAITLDRMARGGLYDQLGGGFHRYATDREWKVPHFEKMLYDNGSLLEIYARAWKLLGDPELARVVRETVAFLERELLVPNPEHPAAVAFQSAIDAETGGQEGAFYVWTAAELEAALGAEDAAFLAPLYGFDRPPFFEHLHYVMHLPRPLQEQAERRRIGYEELLASMAPLRDRLFVARASRPRPATDDKVLADWNGLVIAGLAVAGRLLGEPAWVERAKVAAWFVVSWMRGDGNLEHVYSEDEAPEAFLADYAYVVHGLLELYGSTGASAVGGRGSWLGAAMDLEREQRERLAHPDGGWYGAGESDDLISRSRDLFDGASPSPNGVAVLNLLRLAEITGAREYRDEAERALRGFAPLVESQPAAARTIAIAARRFHESAARWVPLAGEAASAVQVRLDVKSPSVNLWHKLELTLTIAKGWHVATQAAPASAGAATVTPVLGELRAMQWPPPTRTLPGVDGVAVPIWEGEVTIRGEVRPEGVTRLHVVVQPCDDERCLAPVTLDAVSLG